MFTDSFSEFVLPRARHLNINLETAAQRCSVMGEFGDERTTIAYCIAHAWTHYVSFKCAVNALGIRPAEMPGHPLVIDVGCGPGTALVALGEWLHEANPTHTDVRYIGVDRSIQMRALAEAFANDASLFCEYEPLLLPALADVTEEIAEAQLATRDGIIITMSYVLHQEFMRTPACLFDLIRRFAHSRLPIWILSQDANMPMQDEPNVQVWPENRLRFLLNDVGALGYRETIWSRRFESPRYVFNGGEQAQPHATERTKSKAIAARLARA